MTGYLDQVIHQRDAARAQLRAAEDELARLRQLPAQLAAAQAEAAVARKVAEWWEMARDQECLATVRTFDEYYRRWQSTIVEARRQAARADRAEAGLAEFLDVEACTTAEPMLTARFMTSPRQVPACAFCGDAKHDGVTCEQNATAREYLRAFWDRAIKQAETGTGALKRGPLVAFSDEDTADARLLRKPSDAEARAQVRDIIAPHFPGRPGATDCPAWCADGHMYDGSCLIGPALDGIVGESHNPRHPGWYWSCEGGDGACFGWLSLDHPTAAAARRAYDRHVKREHTEPTP